MDRSKPSILVVDDELSIRESFSLILGKDFHVILAASGEAAVKKFIDEKIDLIYLDIRMPGMNGVETLKQIKKVDRNADIVMVTAINDIQNASESIKLGAKNYIVKPFDADEILKMTRSLTQKKATFKEAKTIREKSGESEFPELIGHGRSIKQLEEMLKKIADKDAPVLMHGSSGTETELLARIIHSQSKRSSGPLQIYHVPKTASEDEIRRDLFGWEKGGFVAEFRKTDGMFERAFSGTLLLNNIEFLSKDLQAEIKKTLEDKKFSRIGSMSAIPFDTRIICSSSVDIAELVAKKSFSREFFNLIGQTIFDLPQLQYRASDIPEFLEYFVDKYSKMFNKKVKITQETLDIMSAYPWPGNVVELENTVKQLILSTMKKPEITPDDLPIDILINSAANTSRYTNFENIKKNFEKEYVSKIMKKVDHDKQRATHILGINPKILDSKLESFGMNA